MQGSNDNEDDGSISRLTENESDIGAGESSDQGNNRNRTYPPRFMNDDNGERDRVHRAESDVESRAASFNSEFTRNNGAGAYGGRQNTNRTLGNNHRRKDDDYSHDTSGNRKTYKKSRTVKQLWRSQLKPSCGKRCRFLRCHLEIAIESIVRKASYDSDFIRSVGAGADGILNSGK